MRTKIYFIAGLFLIFSSCRKENGPISFDYGAKNDSAVFYFNKGWEHIMDYGQWTLSERAFRKAVSFDSTFLIGKSLVGKITQNLEERMQLSQDLELQKHSLSHDNLLLMEISLTTIKLMNARDQQQVLKPEFFTDFRNIGEHNYRQFVHKYPHESYMKAEYIEFLHAQHGPELALDSLQLLTSEKQKTLPFFISYTAVLESELGWHTEALEKAAFLEKTINNPKVPAPHMLYAQIYADMDSLSLAKTYLDKVIALDPNHSIAQRLNENITTKLESLSK
ncbi:tetratricopeptide repeat protein [Spongiimicrobium salis]|uniref:hypothetical protein n=1 Tax=Spongiimicrobium salis TaxID=1667022 RepID=UPI00374D8F71